MPAQHDEAARQRMLELLMPQRIEIVKPFTRIKSFDDDRIPDGIELLVRAFNALGDSGPMIVGVVRVELYEHIPATADNRGRRLDHWEISLSTLDDQRRFWNKGTQMYEFRLGIDLRGIPKANKYVLLVTYLSPLRHQLQDEYTIVVPTELSS